MFESWAPQLHMCSTKICVEQLYCQALPPPTHASTSRGSARMIVSVVMSSATRVPLVSLTLSTLVRQPTT